MYLYLYMFIIQILLLLKDPNFSRYLQLAAQNQNNK